jgi:hypothetical protein
MIHDIRPCSKESACRDAGFLNPGFSLQAMIEPETYKVFGWIGVSQGE